MLSKTWVRILVSIVLMVVIFVTSNRVLRVGEGTDTVEEDQSGKELDHSSFSFDSQSESSEESSEPGEEGYDPLPQSLTMYVGPLAASQEMQLVEDPEQRITCPRGTAVNVIGIKELPDGSEVYRVECNDQQYHVSKDALVASESEVIREKEMYVRTPVTLLQEADSASIAGYAPKNSVLQILSYDYMEDNGRIHMYQVRHGDQEGWVFGKYLAFTPEAAAENYNEHGEYTIHSKRIYYYNLFGGEGANMDYFPVEKPSFPDNPFCEEAKAMYLTASCIYSINDYLSIILESGVNAVVLDIKSGNLGFGAEVAKEMSPTAYRNSMGTVSEYRNAVQKLQENGIYVIGRIVVFSDWAYAEDHPESCIKTNLSDEDWLSAFRRDVWEYNVKLAVESVRECGFNEIQFDYVRFPDYSYKMSASPRTDFRNEYNEDKSQAIQNFLFYACDQIHQAGAYVSADVFGECSGAYVTAQGQYWPAISNVVDAISAMPYTDHFQTGVDMWTEPYDTVYFWALSAAARQSEIPTPAAARTWVTGYNTPYWDPDVRYDGTKIREQAQALYDAGLTGGFIPWNADASRSKYRDFAEAWQHDYMNS
ncbi:MAG: hypothetical protein IJM90_07580 [Firmicutes bacterium]|nr:hypothetical protein [Bacillota bacterium]